MNFLLSLIIGFLNVFCIFINLFLNVFVPRKKPTFPPISSKLLTKPMTELLVELRQRKLTSEEIVQAYINRIKQVNPCLNAVIEDRFEAAIRDAQRADALISSTADENMTALFMRFPLLGMPCTIKESCGVKDMSQTVGSMYRASKKCAEDSETVQNLRTAGCIPLLVSANPEFCMSFETNTHVHGRCNNPYDLRRSPAGSSGGEGALNGSGATLFGLGSDIAGSIRLPSAFCGVFGHKPTGGLVSDIGHFPYSTISPEFPFYLQMGPMTRFAKDLPILLGVMAGRNKDKLRYDMPVQLKDIKIYYMHGFKGLNGLFHQPTAFDIKLAITRAVKCFESIGMKPQKVEIKNFENTPEICLKALSGVDGIPSIITQSSLTRPATKVLFIEILRSLIGHSIYTKEALIMEFMQRLVQEKMADKTSWRQKLELLKKELLELLGQNGVLFFPTFHKSAYHHHTSIFNIVGIDYMTIFNVLGFPVTHVPMGLDEKGLPIGFQVISAPYQDKLCLQIATELEGAFGGWVPPIKNEF